MFFESFDGRYGYNLTLGGDGGCYNEEVKQRISKTLTGRKLTEEHKRKIGENSYPHKMKIKRELENPKQKIIKEKKPARKGYKLTEEHKEKLKIARRKRVITEATKEKMKKSANRGDKHQNSKYTELQIKEVISLLLVGENSQKFILNKTGVSIGAIKSVKAKRTWRHLTEGINFE